MKGEIVFDIETQNTFAQVNNDFKKFKISVVSIYQYDTDKYYSFDESEIGLLWPYLENSSRLIGFNSEHFDIPILNNYYPGDLSTFPHLDLIKRVYDSIGRRIKLDNIAKATLDDIKKSAEGLQAVQWWKEGKIDLIKEYCEQDVRVTKEVYEFGKNNKQLFYSSLSGDILPFAVDFENGIKSGENDSKINLTLPL